MISVLSELECNNVYCIESAIQYLLTATVKYLKNANEVASHEIISNYNS
jgi:hypothetical protein